MKLNCEYCGLSFERKKSEYDRNKSRNMKIYCSKACSSKANNNSFSIKKRIPYEKMLEGSKKANARRKDELSPFRYFFSRLKSRKNKENNMTIEDIKSLWFAQGGNCPYTGVKLKLPMSTLGFENKNDKLHNSSIDRINSSLGYVKNNLQFVSQMANLAKNYLGHEEMILFCKAIAEKWRLK